MAKVFEGQEFRHFADRNSGRTFSDLLFRNCTFVDSILSVTTNPRRRSTIRNVTLINSKVISCEVDCAIVEDVLVEEMHSDGFVCLWGAVLKHVTLRGSIDYLKISPFIDGLVKPKQQRPFDEANARYYAAVDWALDIRDAEFGDVDLLGVPGRLVRRGPETQVLARRHPAEARRWRHFCL